LPGRWP